MKFTNKEDAEHLESAIRESYPMTIDWSSTKYIGINLDWNYNKRKLCSSIPGYVKKVLKQFNYQQQTIQKQNSPSLYIAPKFGSKTPQMTSIDTSVSMTRKQKILLQQIVGKFLYYERATDKIVGHCLNDLST